MTEPWEYYRDVFAPGYDPFKESRALYLSGRGHGKTALQELLLERIIYGADLTLDGDVTVAAWSPNRPGGVLRFMTHDSGRHIVLPDHSGVYAVVESARLAPKKQEFPAVASVRWRCAKPTGPTLSMIRDSYPTGSYGWMMAEYASRAVPENPGYNRKLNAKVQAIYDILGVTPHDTNG